MHYDYTFNNSSAWYETEYQIDCENNKPVIVYFERENILLHASADGCAIFFDTDGNELFRDQADGKQRRFSKIYCCVRENKIIVNFPIIKWVDNYPHCDGEYDRWDEIIVEKIAITYTVDR